MKRRSLDRLIEQARRVRDDAAIRAADASGEADRAGETLDLLASYRNESLSRVRTGARLEAVMLGVRERFTRKLDTAIGEQTLQRDRLAAVAEKSRSELLERQRRLLAFETLKQRREEIRREKARRIEQREMDELAAQTRARQTAPRKHDT